MCLAHAVMPMPNDYVVPLLVQEKNGNSNSKWMLVSRTRQFFMTSASQILVYQSQTDCVDISMHVYSLVYVLIITIVASVFLLTKIKTTLMWFGKICEIMSPKKLVSLQYTYNSPAVLLSHGLVTYLAWWKYKMLRSSNSVIKWWQAIVVTIL